MSVFLFNVKFAHKTHLHCGRSESSSDCCRLLLAEQLRHRLHSSDFTNNQTFFTELLQSRWFVEMHLDHWTCFVITLLQRGVSCRAWHKLKWMAPPRPDPVSAAKWSSPGDPAPSVRVSLLLWALICPTSSEIREQNSENSGHQGYPQCGNCWTLQMNI